MDTYFNKIIYYLDQGSEIVIFWAMIAPLVFLLFLVIADKLLKKFTKKLYLLHALVYTTLLTFFFGTFGILILFFITDKNGEKLALCWLAIFMGMLVFSLLKTNSITKMFVDWSKIIQKQKKTKNG